MFVTMTNLTIKREERFRGGRGETTPTTTSFFGGT